VVFRVTSATDGNLYVLRRVDSATKCVNHKICQSVMQQWLGSSLGVEKNSMGGAFDHAGVVRFYKCFLSQRAVFFVHHYHAVGCVILLNEVHFIVV
jgi:PAB-dependent poly(A)-specific ribonuclease subunit 3